MTSPGETSRTIYLKDYRPPDFLIDEVELEFQLHASRTRVRSRLTIRRNGSHRRGLFLDGEELTLCSLALDDVDLDSTAFQMTDAGLALAAVPDQFTLTVENLIDPQANAALSGLYLSKGTFCTQCEAQGFRRITYFIDRPDVLARYTTTMIADKSNCPVLLSNGNRVERVDLGDGRHQATWRDPFPKPSYLFALVAGDLGVVRDEFTTWSKRPVALYIYTEHHNLDKCAHAMNSLRKAMRWDERQYGREYDLDRYMLVVVDDFNMGAMENKGLNIFNSKYVLAKPETATDTDYQHIEAVVGHEYFHNWSGNRVTCRDWFQLSLKEGFTVFREQQFSAAMGSAGVKRIQDVNLLRTLQFREDAGPMAHPVRPQSYEEINNFYTATVYNKGAEVIRMLYHLLGAEGFRRGTDHYFDTYDGQAATTDDFVASMEQTNHEDLSQFRLWYDQAGTPVVEVREHHDAAKQTYTLELKQRCPDTPGQRNKKPFHIPVRMALLDDNGQRLTLSGDGPWSGQREAVLHLRGQQQRFRFEGLPGRPVPSLLRGFSAPVKLEIDRDDADLSFLVTHDDDPFARWEAGQQLAVRQLLRLVSAHQRGAKLTVDRRMTDAFCANLANPPPDLAFAAEMLRLPSETYVGEFLDTIDPEAIHVARVTLQRHLAETLEAQWLAAYRANRTTGDNGGADSEGAGRRALQNLCLEYLVTLERTDLHRLAMTQFETANNMTDSLGALRALVNTDCPERDSALRAFYDRWRNEPLVVDKWFAVQAGSVVPDTFERVRGLAEHPAFSNRNPNKVYALFHTFAHANPARFHAPDGGSYRFIADQIIALDTFNPQVSARLVGAFNEWRRYDARRQGHMREQLERIAAQPTTSVDVSEIVNKSLHSS